MQSILKKMRLMHAALLMISILLVTTGQAGSVYADTTSDAAEAIDTGKLCSLSVTYEYDGRAMSGQNVKIYHIASVSKDFQYSAADEFADCSVRLNGNTSQNQWDQIRNTLEGYIDAEKLDAYDIKQTDDSGIVRFENLTPGLYLVGGLKTTENNSTYDASSFLIQLPALTSGRSWEYDKEALPKIQRSSDTPAGPSGGGPAGYRVIKEWKDGDNKDIRPDSVQVGIYKDGQLFRQVTLDADNNWMWSWTTSDYNARWTVAELNVQDGYSVMTGIVGRVFTITNSLPETDIPDTGVPEGESPGTDTPEENLFTPDIPLTDTPGEYVETGTPIGEPDLPRDRTIDVPEGGIPLTGDDPFIFLWIGLMILSAAGLLAAFKIKGRKK